MWVCCGCVRVCACVCVCVCGGGVQRFIYSSAIGSNADLEKRSTYINLQVQGLDAEMASIPQLITSKRPRQ